MADPGGKAWPGDLRATVCDWLADDPDPVTRAELSDLLDEADAGAAEAVADLADCFAADLAFGTAGLRGALGPGPNRMNLAVVIRAAVGVIAWLRANEPDAATKGIAVCFDARYRSADFAEATVAVAAAAGIRAHLLPGPLPTPVLAFAVGHLGAAAGIMVTASHNPPEDNGYKVFDGTGRQIVAPADAEIASAMAEVALVSEVERTGPDDPDIIRLDDEIVAEYVTGAVATGLMPDQRAVQVAYTAMHGVGAAVFRRVMAEAGFAPLTEVATQVEPDPDFPTVAFPNPEEPGALDLGLAAAVAAGADVLLAHDPDADRLGVAIPDPALGPADSAAGWRALRGDEIGPILAHHLLSNDGLAADSVLATTIVSSALLAQMAEAAEVLFVETLTGFKWLSRAGGPNRTLGFGYEEALGFCAGSLVRDKDGITAGLLFAEAVAAQAAQGRTVLDVLDDLAVFHGVHLTGQWSARVEGSNAMATMEAVMAKLRQRPPRHLAGSTVTSVVDLIDGDPERDLAPSNVLTLCLEGARIVVRPSGTEPKLKCYIEATERVHGRADLPDARDRAQRTLDACTAAIAKATGL